MMAGVVAWLPEIAFHQLWLGALVAGIAYGALRWRSAWTASSRYWLWSGVLAVIALLPLVMMVQTESGSPASIGSEPRAVVGAGLAADRTPVIEAPLVAAGTPVDLARAPIDAASASINAGRAPIDAASAPRPTPSPRVAPSLAALLAFIWLTVVACKLSNLVRGFAVLRRWRRAAVPLRIDFETCEVFESADVTTPMVVGVRQPCILLPIGLREQLTPEQFDFVLAHERAHIRRGDPAMALVQKLIAILYFYNPVVHWVMRHIERERECACDDIAADRAHDREGYASSLIAVARHIAGAPAPAEAMGALGRPSQLKHRIERLLGQGEPRQTWRSRVAMSAASAAVVAAVALFAPAIPVANAANEAGMGGERGRALVEAAGERDIKAVAALIDAGVDIDYAARGDGTALIMAARRGDEPLVRFLIERGANVNAPSRGDGNPLIVAAARGKLDIVKLLVERGAEVNAYVPGDETPLINAARAGKLDVVNYLVAQGADVSLAVAADERPFPEMRSPLSEARRFNRQAVIERLIELGAR